MNTVTHALMPVILANLADGKQRDFSRGALIAIGVSGALPDLLSPHLSLEARMFSWSHGLPAWVGFGVLIALGCGIKRWPGKWGLACWLAYGLHLFCDGISGGINWAYPLGQRPWGDYWFPPVWWVPLDIALILYCYFRFRVAPSWKKRRNRGGSALTARSGNPSEEAESLADESP